MAGSRSLCLVAAAGLAVCSTTLGQANPDPSREVPLSFDSGRLVDINPGVGLGQEPVLTWAQDITVPRAPWMRVHFGEGTVLAGPDRHHGGSYLVITSVADGAKHILDASTLPEWDNISAFMNGDSVLVQLYTVPGAGENRVSITKATAGMDEGGVRTICGVTDDRIPYNDPRVGRLSTGCTAWMIALNGAANEFLTAGHCISNGQNGVVVHFNVPPGTAAGSFVAPPPEFQFPVQSASIQSTQTVIGNDFARFNTNNNSNTGLSPRVAQGRSAYVLASSAPASGSASTTIRGYGTVNGQAGIPLVPEPWNTLGKTHTGPYDGKVGTRIQYNTDTSGGNSGSPVTQLIGFPFLFEQAIGIHTNAGCPGGSNSGTAIENAGLQSALSSPNGVALPYNSTVEKGMNTTFASNNGGADGGSIFFDVATGPHAIEINSLNLNVNREGNSNNATTTEDDDFFNFDVYIRPGTAAGFETSTSGWTLVAEGAGMPKPEDTTTLGALKDRFVLAAHRSYGMAIVFDNGAGHAYTNADGTNETYSNADLTITGISASNSSFGANIAGRVFNGGIGYSLNLAAGQCLETLYAANNGGSNGGMVYFNVVVGSQPVTLTAISTNVAGTGGAATDLTVFRKTGTHVGFEGNPGAWTQVATASGTSAPEDSPSTFALSDFVHLNANTTYGFALEVDAATGGGHRYTNGTSLNDSYSDGRITINAGSATNTPFGGSPFTPRIWNGSFCYGVGLAHCNVNIEAQSPPNANLGGFTSTPGGQEEADNFGSNQNMTLTTATAWGYYGGSVPAPVSQDFVVRIFENSGGLPGAQVATRTVNNVPLVETGLVSTGDRPIYQYNINFTNIALPPGQYWISILGDELGQNWIWNRTNTAASAHAFRIGAGAWSSSAGDFAWVICGTQTPATCYANCDNSTISPILNVADFTCFLQRFAASDPYANCDNSTVPPVLNVADFTCFLQQFAGGCP